ncbi:MAG: hypothetical protein CMP56_04280 [Flavobacteriales bacterium]|nr:hypothetical protein [Flavobacteriales bacterium]
MRKLTTVFILVIIPMITIAQSGISLSGSSQFYEGQSIIPVNPDSYSTMNYKSRDNQITLSIFRGRKFKMGTFAINASFTYSINNTQYKPNNIMGINSYDVIRKHIIPKLELWHILLQRKNIFIYNSIGGYGLLQDLNLTTSNDQNEIYEYNSIIPFLRTGVQISYGKFFINPFISFDLQEITFAEFSDIANINLKNTIQNYNFRSGLEFGIMF